MKHPLVLNFSPLDQPSSLLSLRPRLSEDDATHVHPLVAATLDRSFADLDATIHLPLSMEAQADCDRLSFPAAHIRDASAEACHLRLAADAAVGCYYASWFSDDRRKMRDQVIRGYPPPETVVHRFASLTDVQAAWEAGRMHVHDVMEIRLAPGQPAYCSLSERVDASEGKRAWTTVGRALINAHLPAGGPYFDIPFDETNLHAVLQEVLETQGGPAAERFVERASAFGLHMLTRVGLSLSMADFKPPDAFDKIVEQLKKDIGKFTRLYERGVIAHMESESQIAEAVRLAQEALTNNHVQAIFTATGAMPPLCAILGARGKAVRDHVMRLAAIVGTAWSPWTFRIPAPVMTSLRTGVDPLGYYQLAAIVRHKLVRESMPSSGPRRLQRRIAAALGDVVVTSEDCGARECVVIDRGRDEATAAAFAKLISGRVMTHSLHDPHSRTIVEANQMISPRAAREIAASGVSTVRVRSPLTCRARRGVCRWCYGAERATGRLVDLGAAVGMQAALAIGPTLQAIDALCGRSEIDSNEYDVLRSNVGGVVSLRRLRVVVDHRQQQIVVAPDGELEILTDDAVVRTQRIPHGAVVHVTRGSEVVPGAQLASWSRSHFPIYAQDSGVVRVQTDRSGQGGRFVTILNQAGVVVDGFFLPRHGKLIVAEGAHVEVGASIAASYRPSDYKLVPSRDRLKRLKLIFESRRRRDQAILAPIDARVELKSNARPDRVTVLLHPLLGGEPLQFHMPWDSPRYFIVRHGQTVQPGDPLTRGEVSLGDRVRTHGADEVRPLILSEIWTRLAELKKARPDDDRPWELLVAQMLRYVQIESTGDTAYGVGEIAPWCEVRSVNRALRKLVKVADRNAYPIPLNSDVIQRSEYALAEHQRRVAHPATPPPAVTVPWPAGWSPRLMGVDELARQGSFLTTGGFIPTREAPVLACLSKSQRLLEGMQESVIAGRLMPAGSGWSQVELE